jgi:hypothetical protein
VLMNFISIDPFAGRADEDELFQTRSKFGIVRVLHGGMVSPQEGHTRTGVSSGTSGGHSMAGIEGM